MNARIYVANGIFLCCTILFSTHEVIAEENPDKDSERYYSLRASVYKKHFTDYEKDGYYSGLKLRLSAAVYNYDTFDQLLDPDILHLQSYGLRPRFSFKYPTKWENVTFQPGTEFAVTRQNELGKTLISGSVSGALDYDDLREESRIGSTVGLKYGTRYDEDGLNLDDYLSFSVSARYRQNLKWTIKDNVTTITPFVTLSYFLDELELGAVEELITEIERRYELGITLSTLPRIRLWKIKVPEIKFSFIFGDGVKGFKIRL